MKDRDLIGLVEYLAGIERTGDRRKNEEIIANLEMFKKRLDLGEDQRTFVDCEIAIALDHSGDSLESLQRMSAIHARHPNRPDVVQSMRALHDHVMRQAREIYEQNPTAEVLLRYHQILQTCHYSPTWLVLTSIRILALKGSQAHLAEAVRIMRCLLKLSPRCPDVLSAARELAARSGDEAWTTYVSDHIRAVRQLRPHDLRYKDIEPIV